MPQDDGSADGAKRFDVSVTGGKGVVVGDYSTVFQIFESAPRSLSSQMRVREFRALIEERTAHFVGRDFVFAAIQEALHDESMPSGYVIVRGEPGIGKTSLLAAFVKEHGCVHHFNSAPLGITSPAAFLANVCAQLVVRFGLGHDVLPPEATQDGGFLLRLLDEAAEDPANRPLIVAIDALDEAAHPGPAAAGNRLFLPPDLPSGVFIVATSRDEDDLGLYASRRRDIYLREDDPANQADVRSYIAGFVEDNADPMNARICEWAASLAEFVELLTARSEGNFMYLVHVLQDIRDGELAPSGAGGSESLPRGLRDYYRRHWNEMRGADAERFRLYEEPVVCLLAAVREPVGTEEILAWLRAYWERRDWAVNGLDPRMVLDVVNRWRQFLNVDEGATPRRYRVYHASFQDFLRDEVGLTAYHDTIDDVALAKIPGFLTDGA